jgi:hypothetical protein
MFLLPEVVLQGPRVVAIIGELEPTGMAQHVWVDRESHLGSLAGYSRRSLRSPRISSPWIGCTLEIPFLTR